MLNLKLEKPNHCIYAKKIIYVFAKGTAPQTTIINAFLKNNISILKELS